MTHPENGARIDLPLPEVETMIRRLRDRLDGAAAYGRVPREQLIGTSDYQREDIAQGSGGESLLHGDEGSGAEQARMEMQNHLRR